MNYMKIGVLGRMYDMRDVLCKYKKKSPNVTKETLI